MSFNQQLWSPVWNAPSFPPQFQPNTCHQQYPQARQPTLAPIIVPPSPAAQYAFPSGQTLPFYQQAPDVGTTSSYGINQPGCTQPVPGYTQSQPGLYGASQFPPASEWGSLGMLSQHIVNHMRLTDQKLENILQRMDGKSASELPFQHPFSFHPSIPHQGPNTLQSAGLHHVTAAGPQSVTETFFNRSFPGAAQPPSTLSACSNLSSSIGYKPPEPMRVQSISPFSGPKESSIPSPFMPISGIPPSQPAEPAGTSTIIAPSASASISAEARFPVSESAAAVSLTTASSNVLNSATFSNAEQKSTIIGSSEVTPVTTGQANLPQTYSPLAVSAPRMPAAVMCTSAAASPFLLESVPALPKDLAALSSIPFSVCEVNGQWGFFAPFSTVYQQAGNIKKPEMEREEDNGRSQLETVSVLADKWDAASATSENAFIMPVPNNLRESVETRAVPDVIMQEGQNGLVSTSSVSSSPSPQAMPLTPVPHSLTVEDDDTFSPDSATSSIICSSSGTRSSTTESVEELRFPDMEDLVASVSSIAKHSDAVCTVVDPVNGVPVKKQKVDEASTYKSTCTTPMSEGNKRVHPRKEAIEKEPAEVASLSSFPVPEDDEENLPAGLRRSPSVDSLRSVEIPPGYVRSQQSVNVMPPQVFIVEDAMESCPEAVPERLEYLKVPEVRVEAALTTADVVTVIKIPVKRTPKTKAPKKKTFAFVDHTSVQKKRCAAWGDDIRKEMTRNGNPQDPTGSVPLCFDCYVSERKKAAKHRDGFQEECRFNGARLRCIKFTGKKSEDTGELIVTTKLDLVTESGPEKERLTAEEDKLWCSPYLQKFFALSARRQRCPPKEPATSPKEAVYVLRQLGPIVLHLLNQHENHLADYKDSVAMKHIPPGMTESCDVCATSIFNAHYVCLHCGYCVCPDCFQTRANVSEEPDVEKSRLTIDPEAFRPDLLTVPRDKLDWHACPTNPSTPIPGEKGRTAVEKEYPHALMPTRIIPSEAVRAIQNGINQMLALPIPSLQLCPNNPVDMEEQSYLCDGKVLWFPSHEDVDVEAFRAHWSKGLPVLISGVGKQLTDEASPSRSFWHPDWFAQRFSSEKVQLINCAVRPQETLYGRKHSDFWKGFANVKQRDRDEHGASPLLKIKDWPTDSSFGDLLPDHYKTLCDVLPLPEYTYEKGSMNLTSYMHKSLNPPDLGPKMYIAYGMAEKPDNATTNLHLDISDAVNILVHVSKPNGSDDMEAEHNYIRAAKNLMWNLKTDGQTAVRVKEGHLPGAVWQVYRPQDTAVIRKFLLKHCTTNPDTADDPLHTQMEFLTEAVRQQLLHETGVEGLTIVQFDGDAIFIPAGALHQVWNVHSCIKVAADFVSPEHVSECLHLTEEFRHLPLNFENKTDKLQIKTTLFQTAKNLLPIALHACSSLDTSGNVSEAVLWS